MPKPDGDRAFPHIYPTEVTPSGAPLKFGGETGMSLRDYFAAQICTALVSGIYATQIDMARERIAELTYQIADAMIAERSKP